MGVSTIDLYSIPTGMYRVSTVYLPYIYRN